MANYGILPKQYNGTTYDTLYFKNILNGTTAPTTSTVAYYVGQLYINTTNGDMFKCIAISGSTYTWASMITQTSMTNYIVEYGSSGNISYQKFNDGTIKCWLNSISTTYTGATPVASMGGYLSSIDINMPISSTVVWSGVASGRLGTGVGFTTFLGISTTAIRVYVTGSQNTNAIQLTGLSVFGKWK